VIWHLPRTPSSPPLNISDTWTKIVGYSAMWAAVSFCIAFVRLNRILQSDTKHVATKGRGLFGRQSSSSSVGNVPKSQDVTTSDISQMSDSTRLRAQPRKRSLDAAREGSRLSIFGNTLGGALGKARKPPPRYSA
jgi:hypothetical protein